MSVHVIEWLAHRYVVYGIVDRDIDLILMQLTVSDVQR